MNIEHLRTFVWLRWRLKANQFRRGGSVNAVLFMVFAAFAAMGAIGMLIGGFVVGFTVLPTVASDVRLYVWDGIILAFCFAWLIGMLTDLQRSEGLALDKFLYLPVSVSGVFIVNYVSSLFSLTLMLFFPAVFGLIFGEICAGSLVMIFAIPLVLSFVFALTAITYQFQGWLATLMTNPRRRRNVIVLVTLGVILLAQTPNLINVFQPWKAAIKQDETHVKEVNDLKQDPSTNKFTNADPNKAMAEKNDAPKSQNGQSGSELRDRASRIALILNIAIPVGWVALGSAGLPDGTVLPALLGMLGYWFIGILSLRRAYRTTVRMYLGQFDDAQRKLASHVVAPADPSRILFVERKVRYVSEQASAVAMAALRSLLRAPEAKMALLAPFIMAIVMGGIAASNDGSPMKSLRPLMTLGIGIGVIFLSGVQVIGNQFGFDRTGFRAYVLSPTPRREILIGKNVAMAPVVLGMGAMCSLILSCIYPMRIDHYAALPIQLTSGYLVFCFAANLLSIIAPMPMAAGSMQAKEFKIVPILLQMVFLMVFPIVLLPVFIPIGIEILLEELDVAHGLPISLLLSAAFLALILFIYRRGIGWEGSVLAIREQKILEVVTSKVEG